MATHAANKVVQDDANTAKDDVLYAAEGSGPLFQRDYSARIGGTTWTPEEIAKAVRIRFAEFAPEETAAFQRDNPDGKGQPLRVGDEMKIRISGMFKCKVRVVHIDDRSLTLRTLDGHPEAGRITFGAGRDEEGGLTFRIRSRARAGGLVHFLGYLLIGRAMQGRCWIRFINRVVAATGGRVVGRLRVKTARVEQEPADCCGRDFPTFDSHATNPES